MKIDDLPVVTSIASAERVLSNKLDENDWIIGAAANAAVTRALQDRGFKESSEEQAKQMIRQV